MHFAAHASRIGGNFGIVISPRQSNPAGIEAAEAATLEAGTLTIQDLEALKEVSFFNPDYLHLDYSNEKPRGEEREGA